MSDPYPQRPAAHRLEEASRRFFLQCLPENWTCEHPPNDYGVDLRIDIFEGDDATGLELLVQLKAAERSAEGDTESVVLRRATYNLLRDKLQIVMLVKYSRSENEGYWLLLSDAPRPRLDRDSITVPIPKQNRLSQIDWERIKLHVRDVTDTKLAAMRRLQIQVAGPRT